MGRLVKLSLPHICQNSHYLLNEHTHILIFLVFIIRGSQEQPHYVLKNHHTCWYPWRSVSCSCISFWICFNFSSVTGSVISPTCNHLCFLFVSPKLFNLRKCRNCFIWGKKWWSEKWGITVLKPWWNKHNTNYS